MFLIDRLDQLYYSYIEAKFGLIFKIIYFQEEK